MIHIRPLQRADLPALLHIDATFTADTTLDVVKTGDGLEVGWRLVERRLEKPFDRGAEYNLGPQDLADIEGRLARDDTLLLVAEDRQPGARGRVVALLDLEAHHWNRTAWLWTLYVDAAYRGRGIGRRLMEQAVAWSAGRGLRAIMIETQTNNTQACRFYAHMGCFLTGINDTYYSNRDLKRGEVALFWAYPVDRARGGER